MDFSAFPSSVAISLIAQDCDRVAVKRLAQFAKPLQ